MAGESKVVNSFVSKHFHHAKINSLAHQTEVVKKVLELYFISTIIQAIRFILIQIYFRGKCDSESSASDGEFALDDKLTSGAKFAREER